MQIRGCFKTTCDQYNQNQIRTTVLSLLLGEYQIELIMSVCPSSTTRGDNVQHEVVELRLKLRLETTPKTIVHL